MNQNLLNLNKINNLAFFTNYFNYLRNKVSNLPTLLSSTISSVTVV